MHSGDEPVGLCDTGLRLMVYCLIVFNVRVCLIVFFVLLGFVHFLSFCFTRQRKKKENEPKERKTRLWVLHLLRAQGFLV